MGDSEKGADVSDDTITYTLAVVEGIHLTELLGQFVEVLDDSARTSDPAIVRLTPDAYPGDDDASADFARATRDDLLERRRADAATVQRALEPLLVGDPEELVGDEALVERDVVIDADDLNAWLRTLTALRLVIATRLDITASDDDHDPEDPRFSIYDWLGYRLDALIAIADAQDISG